jgi:hypothetical protein
VHPQGQCNMAGRKGCMSAKAILKPAGGTGLGAAMLRSLFCGLRAGEKRLAVFVAYSDESGVADPLGEFLVAGYVAEEREWPWVVTAWQDRVLNGPPLLPFLHMREIRDEEWRDKHGISFNDSENRISEAVRVLYSMGAMSAIASVIKRVDLQEVIHSKFKRKRDIPVGLDEPDYFCFLAYASFVLAEVYKRHPDVKKINFMVSKKNGVTEHYRDFADTMKRYFDQYQPELSALVGDLIPVSMEEFLPLQAADVLCWHLQRYYAEKGRYRDRAIENRGWYLLKERDGYQHTWERSEIQDVAKGLGII